MKPFLSILIFSLAAMVSPAEPNNVPPITVLAAICLEADSGWSLMIHPDGSAGIGYGSSAFDVGMVPAGTFDFSAVYHSLEPIVQKEGNISEFFTVAFYERGVITTYAQYTRRADIVLPLFLKARENCPLGCERVRELWEKYQPKPKQ